MQANLVSVVYMYDYIVVGGSQAGLAMGYHLKQLGHNFLIVDAADEIGSAWLSRWIH